MNYYRATFRKDTRANIDEKATVQWLNLVLQAANYADARDHAMHVASDHGIAYCTCERLPKAVGEVLIARDVGLEEEA